MYACPLLIVLIVLEFINENDLETIGLDENRREEPVLEY
jgi:hypothetical protein